MPKAKDGSGASSQPSSEKAVVPAPQSKVSDTPTLESADTTLSAALAELRRRPSVEAEIAVGLAYERHRVLDLAQDHFTHALRLNSHSAAAAEGVARSWRDWELPQLGLPYAYRAVAFAPTSASAENTLGTLLFALGDPEAARLHFERALDRDSHAAYALNNLCYVDLMLGNGEPAAARCTGALALDPNLTTARNNLALLYAAEGRSSDAAAEFAKVSPHLEAQFNMGIVHLAKQEYGEAATDFEAPCRAKPEVQGACAWAAEARKLAATQAHGVVKK